VNVIKVTVFDRIAIVISVGGGVSWYILVS